MSSLAGRFPDLRRHFVFEYYPWYSIDPLRHWDEAGRVPPFDLATNYVPALGMYDSYATAVIEQHARWIADSGVAAINVSWWGRGSFEDGAIHRLMDVMSAFDIKVTLHIEPYTDARALTYADDILWILREYGEKRRYDALLLLSKADGKQGPVFKGFAMLPPPESTDCHGVTRPESAYAPEDVWRGQTDRVRNVLRSEFDHITLLSDSLDLDRVRRCGFDGSVAFSNYFRPEEYRDLAITATQHDMLFSVNANSGFDGVLLRQVDPDSCYIPPEFEPPATLDWTRSADRARGAELSAERIRSSFDESVSLQSNPSFSNAKRGFFLMYVNSFNEWHEGSSFEPMKDGALLSAQERAVGYHNPDQGDYRLRVLAERVRSVVSAG